MIMNIKNVIIFVNMLISTSVLAIDKIDLSGKWSVALEDNLEQSHIIKLPGTTDDNNLGTPSNLEYKLERPQLSHLTRKNYFVGKAYYTKDIVIPKDWKNKHITLSLERVLWKSTVEVDGKKVSGECKSLIAPHVHDLTSFLTPGNHTITIEVDNNKQYDVSHEEMAHAYTNETQIKWNGIIGDILLNATDPVFIDHVQTIPNVKNKSVKVVSNINNTTSKSKKIELTYFAESNNGKQVAKTIKSAELKPGINTIEYDYLLGNDVELWSEFNPVIYDLNIKLKSGKIDSDYNTTFGLRDFARNGNVLTNNDIPVFLRGTLECCIFPLTGYPPMTKEEWKKIYNSAKEWGLNHLRFHSWCPPKAAFEAADEIGFYLQAELPLWSLNIGKCDDVTKFLYNEGERIIREYGNHPSFCMMSLGNELQGDMSVLTEMLNHLKSKDSRRLFTTTSFTFEKGHGDWPEKEDDFFITQWTKKGWVRGQGVFNSELPTFNKDYRNSVEGMNVPLITHEIGQYAVYPDLTEIDKYTGVLDPVNFKSIKKDLEDKNLISCASEFLQGSGKLAALLYKEEIERALKTAGISGYQLLDLHDFPGQGTALVGLLNVFWESKGVIDSEVFRNFCSPVVPLLRFPKAVYQSDESFIADVEISNYWNKTFNKNIKWNISNDNGKLLKSGSIESGNIKIGHNEIPNGKIEFDLKDIKIATKLSVYIEIEGTEFSNKWDIWVYPKNVDIDYGKVKYTKDYNQAKKWLDKGMTVLYNPDWKTLSGIEGKFVPVFWSPVHFPKQAGTMGLLCDENHNALKDFPTENYTNWQWWDLNINSRTLITDSIIGGDPIVKMIDNFTNNRRLASVYEGSVGKGKVIISSIDLDSDLDNRPVARQMLYSLINYMNSSSFNPSDIKNFEIFNDFIIDEVNNKRENPNDIY